MKAITLKAFVMGNSHFKQDQIIDLDEAIIKRLVNEGLVIFAESASLAIPEDKSESAANELNVEAVADSSAEKIGKPATTKLKKKKKK